MFSIVRNLEISFFARFGPIPGTPETLSDASPAAAPPDQAAQVPVTPAQCPSGMSAHSSLFHNVYTAQYLAMFESSTGPQQRDSP